MAGSRTPNSRYDRPLNSLPTVQWPVGSSAGISSLASAGERRRDFLAAVRRLDPALPGAQKQEGRPLLGQESLDLSQAARRVRRHFLVKESFDTVEKVVHRFSSRLKKGLVDLKLMVKITGKHQDVLLAKRQGP